MSYLDREVPEGWVTMARWKVKKKPKAKPLKKKLRYLNREAPKGRDTMARTKEN